MDDDCSVSDASTSEENNSASDILGDELSCSLSGKLKVDPEKQTSRSNNMQESHVDASSIEDENESNEEDEDEELSEEELLTQMGYAKSTPKRERANEPRKKETFNAVSKEEEDNDLSEGLLLSQTAYVKNWQNEAMTTPGVHMNLIPALKGSREKWAGPSGERRVSWAPDVYDPPPTYSEFLKPAHQPELREGKNQQKDGEGEVGSGKGKKSGGSKSGVERWKTEGAKGKNKKYDNKKQAKKRGGRGGGGGDFCSQNRKYQCVDSSRIKCEKLVLPTGLGEIGDGQRTAGAVSVESETRSGRRFRRNWRVRDSNRRTPLEKTL